MSERSEYVHVYDKKRKVERTVTRAAYKILAGKTYDLIGEVPAPEEKKVYRKKMPNLWPLKPERAR